MSIINLTQHPATPEQKAEGVVDFTGPEQARLQRLLTLGFLPHWDEVEKRAEQIAALVALVSADPATTGPFSSAMIGGAPFLMGPLAEALNSRNITPMFAFTLREVTETIHEDGTVTKTSKFSHEGFVVWGGA